MKKLGCVLASICLVLSLVSGMFVPAKNVQAANGRQGVPDYVDENGHGYRADEVDGLAHKKTNALKIQQLEGGPSVETLGNYTCFFANGTPITVLDGTQGASSTLITWEEGQYEVADATNLYVFGGSHNTDTVIENANITVNGGLIHILSAGGLHRSHTVNSTVTINGGQITNLYAGSVGFGHGIDSCPTTEEHLEECVIEHTQVDFNQGVIQAFFGGGMAYQRAKETVLNLNGGQVQQFLVIAGANGATGNASLHIQDSAYVGTVYGAARGTVDTISFDMDGGTVKDLFVGTDGAAEDDAKIGHINATVKGGIVEKLEEVYFGLQQIASEEEVLTKTDLEFYENTLKNFPEFLEGLMVHVIFHLEDLENTVLLTKGTEVAAYEPEPNPGYVVDGWYVSEEYTGKWDFATPVTEDMNLYGKWKESKISTAVLEYALKLAKEADTTNVIDIVVEKLNVAIEKAEGILAGVETGDPDITQEIVDESWQELVTLMQYLSFKNVDKSDLEKVIEFARTFNLDEFLEIGQDAFHAALSNAQNVYDDINATQQEVNEAVKDLLKASSELRRKPDKDALEGLLKQAQSLSAGDYESEGFATLCTVIAQAKAVYENPQATKEEVTAQEVNLKNAIAGLVPVTKNEEMKADTTVPVVISGKNGQMLAKADQGSNANGKQETTKSAKTGDDAAPILPAAAAMMAMAASMVVIKRKFKR